MKYLWRLLVLLGLTAVGVNVLAVSDPPPQEDASAVLAQNRRLLEKWRSDPEHFARLQRDYQVFLALSPERQARLRQFDRELHAEDPSTQARLWGVLERYVAWLERLPQADRTWIEASPDSKVRLERVRVIRDQQWVQRLPRKVREELEKLPDDKRSERIAELRGAERQRRLDWFWASHPRNLASLQQARPSRLSEFPLEVRFYFSSMISHVLPDDDLRRLRETEGHWPLYARALAKALETSPPALTGFPDAKVWPTRFPELPADWKAALAVFRPIEKGGRMTPKHRQEIWRKLTARAGKWPDYAITATSIVRDEKLKVETQLGPNKLDHFPPAFQEAVRRQMFPVLTRAEREELATKEGKWPDYPETVNSLARRHNVALPGTARPCPPEFWEAMTKLMPDVPGRALRNFLLTELSPEERGELKLAPDGAVGRQALLDKYWARHPEELNRQLSAHGSKQR